MRAIAEFEPIASIWLCWPHNPKDWPGKIEAARWAFIEFVRAITEDKSLRVKILTPPNRSPYSKLLKGLGPTTMARVELAPLETDRSWMRDVGPSWVEKNGTHHAVCWDFNGWAKYPNHRRDQNVAPWLAQQLMAPTTNPIVVMEGGAIDTNGQGVLLATRECLLHPTQQVRNPGFTQHDYETLFHDTLGIHQVLWLEGGITGDDTHGHIDDVARWANTTTILCAVANKDHPDYDVMQENLQILRSHAPPYGGGLTIVPVPLPTVFFDGERLPASYLNFVILNDRVLVPTFNHAYDRESLHTISRAVGRPAIGVHAVDLVWGYGTLHCLSHQSPL